MSPVVDDNFVLEQWAFWATTGGIVVGAVTGFSLMHSYLKARKIL
jgi:magnesium transporter